MGAARIAARLQEGRWLLAEQYKAMLEICMSTGCVNPPDVVSIAPLVAVVK